MSTPVDHGTPRAEVGIDAALVRALLADQHPDLVGEPLAPADSGWDNAMFRLGEARVVRLPRRAASADLVLNEQAWLPALADRLPIPVPAPERVGRPACGYPWSWSVLPWLPGEPADQTPPDAGEAEALAGFLAALHGPAPADAPRNPVRGVPLPVRAPSIADRLEALRARTDAVTPGVEATWASALAAPPAPDARWLHGDLHPRNVLVERGRVSAIVDWGDVTAGDVATDLASVWMLFADRAARRRALAQYLDRVPPLSEPAEAVETRARGWAVLFGVVLLATGLHDQPRHAAIGAATLARISEDAHSRMVAGEA